jgi:NAD(P)-dependent dehydrogenase (short-subunit alcohol dehydrogenase family)
MQLKSRSAIVTGSTSAIGLGIARAFAAQGANVMLNGFGNADEIEFTRSELQREFGVEVLYSGADMSRPEHVRALAELAEARFGRVDIVVNMPASSMSRRSRSSRPRSGTRCSPSTCRRPSTSSRPSCRA